MKPQRVELSQEMKNEMIGKLKTFYKEKRGEEIGELAARLLMDFMLNEVAPYYYNQGIRDSIPFMNERVDDLYTLEI